MFLGTAGRSLTRGGCRSYTMIQVHSCKIWICWGHFQISSSPSPSCPGNLVVFLLFWCLPWSWSNFRSKDRVPESKTWALFHPVCMFDKFHLMLNFKSKVCGVFNDKKAFHFVISKHVLFQYLKRKEIHFVISKHVLFQCLMCQLMCDIFPSQDNHWN